MEKAINLLWTSGWDSTFRLLEIIFKEKKKVQPYYIIDHNRKNSNFELKAIDKILKGLEDTYPTERKLILPLIIKEKKDINIPIHITNAFNKINTVIRIGTQYEWLAAFCEQEKLTEVELSVFKNERTLQIFNDSNQSDLKNAIHTLYKNFSFPLLDVNKMDMLLIARENNWLQFMNSTWFCHKPKNGKPCGKCNPCLITIKEGLGFRIPFINRLKGKIKIAKKRVKKSLGLKR